MLTAQETTCFISGNNLLVTSSYVTVFSHRPHHCSLAPLPPPRVYFAAPRKLNKLGTQTWIAEFKFLTEMLSQGQQFNSFQFPFDQDYRFQEERHCERYEVKAAAVPNIGGSAWLLDPSL